jgi:hypothetical protein
MMRFRTVTTISIAVLLLLSLVDLAVAQVPPHAPGSICFTPNFWCWANPPGPPGWACYCPSPQGLIRGTLG